MSKSKVLIKFGGNAMVNEKIKNDIAEKIRELQAAGIQVILVHGGGPFINQALNEAAIPSRFFDGHRYTSPEAMRCIERTLKGEVNSSLVTALNQAGLKAVGISGKDGRFAFAQKRNHQKVLPDGTEEVFDLGLVGELTHVDTHLLELLLQNGYTPVVACIATDADGRDYNVNGDVFAGKIASALKVDNFIVLTDVDGLYKDYPDPASLIAEIDSKEVKNLFGTAISGGMIPKISACLQALQEGVGEVVIVNGTKPHLLTEVLIRNSKHGTKITP